jgi:hypothetical protein
VDAIVRPLLTPTQVTQVTQYLNIGTVVFIPPESFREISGMGEWAPPLGIIPSATPPGQVMQIMHRGEGQQEGEGGRPITSDISESLSEWQNQAQTRMNACNVLASNL